MPFKKNTYLNTTRSTSFLILLIFIICLFVLIVWAFHIRLSPAISKEIYLMKVNTIAAILLACIAHSLLLSGKNIRAGRVLSAIVFLTGALSFAENIFKTDFGIDELLLADPYAPPPLLPGQMSQAAATGLMLTGASMSLNLSSSFRWKLLSDILVSLVAIASFLVCTGKALDAEFYNPIKLFSHFSLFTSACLLFLSLGILFSRPQSGLLSPFYENSWAANVGTRQFLLILGIMLVVGWFCNAGSKWGFYNPQLGTSIMIAVFVVSFFFIIRSGVVELSRSEKQKEILYKQIENKSALINDVLERVKDPFIALDKNWCFTYINEKAGYLTRRDKESLIGKNIWKEFPELAGTETWHALHKAMNEQCVVNTRAYYAPFEMWHEDTIYPSPEGLSVFVQDITEKMRAEQELEESRAKYRSIFDHSPDGILLTILDGNVLAANAAACSMFMMTEEEICNSGRQGLVDISDPNLPVLLQERSLKGRTRGELTFKRKDGSTFPGEITSVVFKDRNGFDRSSMLIRDISEQKKAEDKLARSELKYRKLFENNLAGIYQTSVNGDIISCNNAFARILGYGGADELIGKKASDMYFTLQDRKQFLERLQSAGVLLNNEEKLKHRDGSGIYVLENCYLGPEEKDGSRTIDGVLIDITERKRADDQLRESETRYRTLMQEAGDLIVVFSKDGSLLDVNESAYWVLGYSKDEFRGKKLTDFVFAEDLVKLPFQFDLLDAWESTITRRRLRKKDGSAIEVEIHAKRLSDSRYLAVARDMTERLKAEKVAKEKDLQLREISSAIPGFIYQFFMDKEGSFSFKFISESVSDIVGLRPEEVYKDIGLAFSMVHPEDLPGLLRSVADSAATMQSWTYVFRVARNDTEIQWFRGGSSVPKKNEDGSVVWNGAMFDITELKTAEEKLETSYQAIRELTGYLQDVREEERTAIAREIHDELGQQLTVMMIDMAWLSRKAGPGNIAVANKIEDVLVSMEEMVKTVRRISTALRPSMLDDLGIVAAIEMQLSEFGKKFDIQTRFAPPDTEPLLDASVKNGLFRILQESLTNVARHSLATHVTVAFEVRNNVIHLAIEDNGKGFDENISLRKKTLGVLGMKERAVMMGGEYRIAGMPGKGTSVHIIVPLRR